MHLCATPDITKVGSQQMRGECALATSSSQDFLLVFMLCHIALVVPLQAKHNRNAIDIRNTMVDGRSIALEGRQFCMI